MKKILHCLIVLMFISNLVYGVDSEVQDLTDITSPELGDDLYIVDNPDGTPISRKINIGNLLGVSPDKSFSYWEMDGNTIYPITANTVTADTITANTITASTVTGNSVHFSLLWNAREQI